MMMPDKREMFIGYWKIVVSHKENENEMNMHNLMHITEFSTGSYFREVALA